MKQTLQRPLPPMALTAVDQRAASRSTAVDQALETLRRCVSDCGWTYEALAKQMKKDKAHVHRVLNGLKPLTLDFLTALPDDVEALFERRRAEHFGLIVVQPAAAHEAMQQLVSGLVGVLAIRSVA